MKKFFGIIVTILVIFSMNIAAFAGFTSMTEAEKAEKIETVIVEAALQNGYTPITSLETFEKHEVKNEEVEEIKGRVFIIDFTITNNTKDVIYAKEVIEGFDVVVTEPSTGKVVSWWTKAKDAGFSVDLSKIAINPDEAKTLSFKIYAITNQAVEIKVTYEGKSFNVENGATFTLMVEPISTTETIKETTIEASKETTTEMSKVTVTTETVSATTEAVVVEDTIPNTGESATIGFIGLALSAAFATYAAIATYVVTKRKDK